MPDLAGRRRPPDFPAAARRPGWSIRGRLRREVWHRGRVTCVPRRPRRLRPPTGRGSRRRRTTTAMLASVRRSSVFRGESGVFPCPSTVPVLRPRFVFGAFVGGTFVRAAPRASRSRQVSTHPFGPVSSCETTAMFFFFVLAVALSFVRGAPACPFRRPPGVVTTFSTAISPFLPSRRSSSHLSANTCSAFLPCRFDGSTDGAGSFAEIHPFLRHELIFFLTAPYKMWILGERACGVKIKNVSFRAILFSS